MPFIIVGNPKDGFDYIGPFESSSEAIEWATDNVSAEWWQVDLQTPAEYMAS